jgi:hypothetical protein
MPTRYEVVVDVQAPAADVERVVRHWGQVTATGDDSCRLLMNVDSFEWPTFVLTIVGAAFEVVGPVEFADYLRHRGELFAGA